MKLIVCNAFSLNMLELPFNGHLGISTIEAENAAEIARVFATTGDCINAIGHESTDMIVRGELLKHGCAIQPGSRTTIKLTMNTMLIVAQYSGARLQEGATQLPEDATIEWMLVAIGK